MYLVVGLGNPGRQYESTRHNMGFDTVDYLVEEYKVPQGGVKFNAMYGKGRIEGQPVILMKPLSYMNLSGESLREIIDFYKLNPAEELIVIYDDISLDVGKLRIRAKGSAGGHNGIKNIIVQLGTQEVTRIKIGVGEKPAKMDLADYVLGRFSKEEQPIIRESADRAREAVCEMITHDVASAMNKFN